ncbi:MAG: hypothetical protein ACR2MN_01575 [Acidimicrobiales bacterium]
MEPEEREAIVEGVAALTVTLAEMGLSEVEAQQQLMARLNQLEAFDVQLLMDAAAAIGAGPLLSDERPEETVRHAAINRTLVGPADQDERVAAARGREWLQRLAGCQEQ